MNNFKVCVAKFEVVFIDVNMPEVNGFEAARSLRKVCDKTVLVFVTNFSRYAIKEYEHDATDYDIKPLEYPLLAKKLKKLFPFVKRTRVDNCFLVNLKHVKQLDGFEVIVREETLTICHSK